MGQVPDAEGDLPPAAREILRVSLMKGSGYWTNAATFSMEDLFQWLPGVSRAELEVAVDRLYALHFLQGPHSALQTTEEGYACAAKIAKNLDENPLAGIGQEEIQYGPADFDLQPANPQNRRWDVALEFRKAVRKIEGHQRSSVLSTMERILEGPKRAGPTKKGPLRMQRSCRTQHHVILYKHSFDESHVTFLRYISHNAPDYDP